MVAILPALDTTIEASETLGEGVHTAAHALKLAAQGAYVGP